MNLQRFSALLKVNLKKLIRQPATLFLMLLFPAVLTLVFGLAFSDPASGMDFNVMVPGLFAYAVIFMIMTVAQSFSDERQGGLLKRLNVTPMTSGEFMGSHIISNMVTAVLQMAIVFVIALPFGFTPQVGVGGMLFAFLMMSIFSLSSIGLGLITATIAKSPEAATGVSFIFILPQMFLGTFMNFSGAMEVAGRFVPSYYLTDAVERIFFGTPLTDVNIWIDFAILSITSFVIIIIGILLFKKYGKA
ncbi:MAG: ABC transporter permease [Candidatus Helarchaeota archaeon]|nr:ABC transporter permease [Candidatus Helarchaeota archaeon]